MTPEQELTALRRENATMRTTLVAISDHVDEIELSGADAMAALRRIQDMCRIALRKRT